jgi:hypothetical protein
MNVALIVAAVLANPATAPTPAAAVATPPVVQAQEAKGAPDGGTAKSGPDLSLLPFTQDTVRKVVASHQPQIQACYEEWLANQSKPAEGKLQAHWVITPEGLVKGARIEKKGTTLKDPKLHDCVLAAILAMEFPKPIDKRDHPIDYPFNLKAIK